jgi:hypothetical protein
MMNIFKSKLWVWVLMLVPLSSHAQDSARKDLALWYEEGLPYLKKPADTGMTGIHLINPVRSEYIFFQDLGNYGSPAMPIQYQGQRAVGFQHGIRVFDQFMRKADDQRYWNVKKPYTDIRYSQGKGRLLQLELLHTQNVSKNWNVGIQLHRLGARGLYQHQNTDWYHTRVFSSYISPSGKYANDAYILFNRGSLENNGGVDSPNGFDSASADILKEGFATRLTKSETRVKEFTFHLRQALLYINKKDTNQKVNPSFSLSHILDITNFTMNDSFSSADLTYFTNTYNNNLYTKDSLRYFTINNKLELASTGYRANGKAGYSAFLFQAGMMFTTVKWYNNNLASSLYNTSIYGAIKSNPEKKQSILYQGSLQYILAGYNMFDYKLSGSAGYSVKKFLVKGVFTSQRFLPDEQLRNFNSNHYVWAFRPDKSQLTSLHLIAETKPQMNKSQSSLQMQLQNILNPVYLNEQIQPQQLSGTATIFSAMAKHTLKFKKLYTSVQALYQEGGKNVIRVPRWSVYVSAYIQAKYGKSPLRYQLGADLFWNSSYQSYSYDPLLHQFYIQNKWTTGNYPMVDVFLNGELKQFNVFVKVEHILQTLTQYKGFEKALPLSYYSSPYYPFQGQAIRMGFRWRFYS